MANVNATIGLGKEYTSFATWAADWDDAEIYDEGDTATAVVSANKVYDENITLNKDFTNNLAGLYITPALDSMHTGVELTGVLIQGKIIMYGNISSSLIGIEQGMSEDLVPYAAIEITAGTSGITRTVAHCMIHDCNVSGVYISGNQGGDVYVMNNYIYNNDAWGIRGVSEKVGVYLYNNTVYNNTSSGIVQSDATIAWYIKNNLVVDSGSTDISVPEYAVHDYNATSDTSATGDNSIHNVVTGDTFNSVEVGSLDLSLVSDAVVVDEGVDLSGLSLEYLDTDVVNDSRVIVNPANLGWDIGGDEYRLGTADCVHFISANGIMQGTTVGVQNTGERESDVVEKVTQTTVDEFESVLQNRFDDIDYYFDPNG